MTDRTDHLAASVQALVNGRLAAEYERGRLAGRQEAAQAVEDAAEQAGWGEVWAQAVSLARGTFSVPTDEQ